MKFFEITVSEKQSTQRLDKWVGELDFVTSRSRAAELITKGLVTLSGVPLKASQKIAPGMIVRIEIPAAAPTSLQAWDAPLDIAYEDADVIVVNKPAGLVMHPAAGHAQDTLVNILLHHTRGLSMGFNEQRPGIVHRLDRDTSGLVVIAKNDHAHLSLAAQFKQKTTHRIYWALTHRAPRPLAGRIETLIARHPTDRKRFASHPNLGKRAVTHYKTLKSNADYAWVECRLETGRTHQIRVHLSELGHPLLGDPVYGAKNQDKRLKFIKRMALHACELGFEHPRSGKPLAFKADFPPLLREMAKVARVL